MSKSKITKQIPFWIMWIGLIILSIIILSLAIASSVILSQEINSAFKTKDKIFDDNSKFYTNFMTTTGIENQTLVPSWVYAFTSFAEASYFKNGYEKGYLDNNTYVRFSENTIYGGLKQICENHPNDMYCIEFFEEGSAEIIYYLYKNYPDEVSKIISPFDINDSTIHPSSDSNPISFKINGITSVYTKNKLKELLLVSRLPVVATFGRYNKNKYMPCDNNFGYDCDSFKDKEKIICPTFINSQYCHVYSMSSLSKGGVYDASGSMEFNGKHSGVVVGWNDDMKIDRSMNNKLEDADVGGFVVKNSYGTNHGHSMNWWLQLHSIVDENQLCPNFFSSLEWVPLNIECAKNNTYEVCSKSFYKNVKGKDISDKITPLKCIPNVYPELFKCDETKEYYLAAEIHEDSILSQPSQTVNRIQVSDGMFRVKVIKTSNYHKSNSILTDYTEEYILPVTHDMLEEMFEPNVDDDVVNGDECGFDFLPYDTFDKFNINYVVDSIHSTTFTNFDIEWDDRSYLKNKDGKYDYKTMEESTKQMKRTYFNGPADF